jgi:hypothetical protein
LHPEVSRRRQEVGYVQDLETASDQNEKRFFDQVKKAGNPIKREIQTLVRIKNGKDEHFYYHETLRSTDSIGNEIHHYRVVGKYDDETYEMMINPNTGEKMVNGIQRKETVYEFKWPDDFTEELEDLVLDKCDLLLITRHGRHYGGFTWEQFTEESFEDLETIGRYGTKNPKVLTELKKDNAKWKTKK